jgi:hypothetical protein
MNPYAVTIELHISQTFLWPANIDPDKWWAVIQKRNIDRNNQQDDS